MEIYHVSTTNGFNHNWHGERHSAESVARAMAGHWAEFYGLYAALKPAGRQLCGPCPLHRGEGPNFKVDPDTGRWYCHSQCGRGGDVFQFIERYHQASFADAVLSLARWVGLPVPDPLTLDAFKTCPVPRSPETAEADRRKLDEYFQSDHYRQESPRPRPALTPPRGDAVSDAVAARCHDALLADREILTWLRVHRGLTRETLVRFGIGLTDGERDLCWPRITFPVRDRAGQLTSLRKHLFAFDPDLNRAKYGKTLPWAAGLPADLFPLSVLWGHPLPSDPIISDPTPSDPTPAASSDPSLGGKGVWREGSPVGSEGSSVTDGSRPEDAAPFDTPFPPREGSALAPGIGSEGPVLLTDHILLVEGEADALLANQMGIPALSGTLGAGGWRPQNTRDLAGLARLTILYDADDAGRKGAKARAQDLAGTIPDIRLASLPPGLGSDLTEWVLDGGGTPEGLHQIIAAAEQVRGPRPEPTPGAEGPTPGAEGPTPGASADPSLGRKGEESVPTPPSFLGKGAGGLGLPGAGGAARPLAARTVDLADVPPPPGDLPYLWGAYLNEGASHWLTGKTGLGKSTFAFNLACALAEGRTLWGVPCTARRLLYVDLESGDLGRSLKIQRLYGDRPRRAGQLRFVREPLRLPDESAELIAYAAGEQFDLVIFDTARRVFAVRDENDNAEVYNRVIPTLDALKARGIATLTMGHPPKNGGLGARGAGAQEDAGDVNLLLTMHRGEVSDADGVIALSITKNRLLGLGQPPLYLKRIGHDQFERLDAQALHDLPPAAGGDNPEKQSPRDRCRAAVLALLESNRGEPVAYKDLLHGLEAQGHNRATLHRSLKELMDEGEVNQPSSGRYVLSDPFA